MEAASQMPQVSVPAENLPPVVVWDDSPEEIEATRRRWRFPLTGRAWILVACAFVVGAAASTVVMRMRYRAGLAVASVNGVIIEEPAFRHRLETVAGDAVLRQMVNEEAALQYARKLGVSPAEQQVERRYQKISSQPDFVSMLATTHQTPDDVKQAIRVQLAEHAIVTAGTRVSDADVTRYYQQQADRHNPRALYFTPETITIEQIVTNDEASIQRAAAALARGDAFDRVARRYSTDVSRARGGVSAPIQRGRSRLTAMPAVEAAVFRLGIGEQLGPLRIAGKWYIVRCLERQPESTKPFTDVAAECRDAALLQKALPQRAAQVHAAYADFQKKSTIRAFWTYYKAAIGAK